MRHKETILNDKITIIQNNQTGFIIGHIEKLDTQLYKVFYGFGVYTKYLGNRFSKATAIEYILSENE